MNRAHSKLTVVLLAAFALLLGSLSEASATLTFYTDRTTFEGANPGLPTEDFEDGTTGGAGFVSFDGPLDSTTNNGVFAPGDILPGIAFAGTGEASGGFSDLILVDDGVLGVNSSKWVGINFFADDASVISLGSGFGAIGMDLLSVPNLGATQDDVFDIDIFDGGGLIGSTTATIDFLGSFWGVSSDMGPITGLRISSQIDGAEFFDNVTFGDPIPEPTATLLFGLGFTVVGCAVRRERKG
jgi:hypothetical protein